MDGTIDDPLWRLAEPITNFSQREPYEGQPPTERTEVRVLYTKGEIYFGISCRDSEPGKVVATQLRRDVSQELDDYFEIVIDSSHNRRNAYVLHFNPLGTQRDALITDEQSPQDDGSDGDSGWDGVWISEARITSRAGPPRWPFVIPNGLYHWTRHQLTYGTAQDRRWVLRFFERFGTYYNGHLNEARVRASYRPNERLSFDFSQQ